MSFTYTQPWASTRDYVRFLVGDTKAANAVFDDEELDSLVATWGGDGRLAAAEALDGLAALYARGAIMYQITGSSSSGGFQMDRRKVAEALQKQAASLRKEASSVPFEFESVVDQDVDSSGLDWSNYVMQNPEVSP